MSSIGGYKIRNQKAVHFITFAVTEWVDVFTRKIYTDIVIESLQYCQQHKGLTVHAWCIMSNHVHLLISANNNDVKLSDIIRDFKKHTSKAIIQAIQLNEKESRKEWILAIFSKFGKSNSRNTNFQFWRQDNHPMEIYSAEFIAQKMNYIHYNPVVAGIVSEPWHYIYSSATDYYNAINRKGLLQLESL
jgi:putative transposase